MQALGLGGFYFLTLVFFSIQAPHFFEVGNGINILSNVSVIGIVTLGQMLVLIAGGFDLSVAGTGPLGGVGFTIPLNHRGGLPGGWRVRTQSRGVVRARNGAFNYPIGRNPPASTV